MTLSQEKIKECKEQFDLFDHDKDKYINKKELGDIFRTLGENLSNEELVEIINMSSKNSSGKISYKEFLVIYDEKMKISDSLQVKTKKNETSPNLAENEYLEAFKLFDKDGTGMIPAPDLKEVMVSLGEISELEANQIVNDADYNNDGFIHYHEFVYFMMKIKQ